MTETLAIRMSTAHDGVEWLVIDEAGAPRGPLSAGDLGAAASLAAERPVLVVIDDVAVTRTSCDLPVSGRRLAQALPYALEEQFASDVDTLHFAAGDADAEGHRPVAALEREAIAGIVERLAAAGIVAQRLHSWHDAISPLEGFVQMLIVDDQVLVCDGTGAVAALRGLPPDAVLEAWRAAQPEAEDGAEDNLRVFHDGPARERFGASLDALREDGADVKQLADGLLPFAARHLAARGGINLLQGEYAVRSDVVARLRPWVLAASLAGVALLLSIVVNAVELRRLERVSTRLDGDIAQLLQQVQPGSGNVRNPEGQLRALVNRSGGGGAGGGTSTGDAGGAPFLPTLGTLAGALEAAGEDTRVDAISYRGGVFDVRLTTPSAQTLERLTQRVADAGRLTAQIQRTEQDEDAIRSFLQIRGEAP